MDTTCKDRTVGVPRGLLRFLVLKMLSEKPMAGVEISEEIEIQTNGHWKPSPGSIYPLMALMRKKGLTKELPKDNEGLKRNSFTQKGREFLEKQISLGQEFMKKMEFLMPMLMGGLQLGPSQKKFRVTREPARRLLKAFLSLNRNIERISTSDLEEITKALRDCSQKLEKIAQKIT